MTASIDPVDFELFKNSVFSIADEMALTVFRRYYQKMGLIRFMLMANLLLFMAALPIKMVLRWVFNLKYIIWIPEWFLNF